MNRNKQCDVKTCATGMMIMAGMMIGAVTLGFLLHQGIEYAEWFVRHVWG